MLVRAVCAQLDHALAQTIISRSMKGALSSLVSCCTCLLLCTELLHASLQLFRFLSVIRSWSSRVRFTAIQLCVGFVHELYIVPIV